MSIFNSTVVGLFCISFVFLLLAILYVLVRILTAVVGKIDGKISDESKGIQVESQAPAAYTAMGSQAVSAVDNVSAGDLKLQNVDEKTAAIIMAIVSDETKIPLSELCFKSIKAID
jgi:Na+-transporting methylmalonyl-CoA/oxaloacetate decarboxylase gamma subunit